MFADFDTTSNRLGNTVKDKNARLAAVLKGVEGLKLGDFNEHQIDLFGDAYEFLISNYAANAGKSGGEFFTPQHVSKLIAQLAMHGQTHVNKIYDPAAGSGSLLLQAKKQFDDHIIEEGFFGQEINHTTYNLARMNMFLHNINYDKFDIKLGNTLTEPHFRDEKPFDAIVSNPPYSVKWIGSDDPTLINDERFAPAGVLAPKSKADFAFVLHALNYLSAKGRAAIVCFPGIFYRGGAEQKIRQYLVDNNYVETVISLAPNLFFGTTIAVNILVLSKHKTDTLSGGCHPEVTVSDICKRKPGFAGCLTTINHQLVRGIAAIKANTHIDGATLTGEVIGGQFMERYRGVAFCNSTAQRSIRCRLIIKANLPCVNNIAGTDHIAIQYHAGTFTELCSATQTSPGSQRQCSTMPDSGVADQSSGINRKAAAIFQQQSAGLTGCAINTELTAGIGPLNSGTTVCNQGTTGCHGDICCLTTGRHCQGSAVIHQCFPG
ncbi:hypothetical protein VEE44_37280 [Escherichia coli]|nr:hypothetical protein VEE44_37280 [Escherichia coli]